MSQGITSRSADWARWGGVTVAMVAGISVLAGRTPDRFALPGLFGVGFGALVGLGAGEMACRLRLFCPRALAVVVALITAAGFVGVSLQWQQSYALRSKPFIQPVPGDPLQQQLRESLTPVPPNETPAGRAARESVLAGVAESEARRNALRLAMSETQTIRGYLRSRWENFGFLKSLDAPWPLVLWSVELVAAVLLAAGITWYTVRSTPTEPPV